MVVLFFCVRSKKCGLFRWKLYNPNRQETSGRAGTEHFSSYLSSQHLRPTVSPFLLKASTFFPTFLFILWNQTTLLCTEGLQKTTGRELLTFSLPQPTPITIPQRPLIRMISFIFCGVGQWISLLFLFSNLHFPTASLFGEALKRWLAFRWQNTEKVRAVPHNAAMHRAHQLLKHHSHKLNASSLFWEAVKTLCLKEFKVWLSKAELDILLRCQVMNLHHLLLFTFILILSASQAIALISRSHESQCGPWLVIYSYWANSIETRPRNNKSLNRDHSTCIECYCVWVIFSNWNLQRELRSHQPWIYAGYRRQDSYPHEFCHYLCSIVCIFLFNLSQNRLKKCTSIEKQILRTQNLFLIHLLSLFTSPFSSLIKAVTHVHLPPPPSLILCLFSSLLVYFLPNCQR